MSLFLFRYRKFIIHSIEKLAEELFIVDLIYQQHLLCSFIREFERSFRH